MTDFRFSGGRKTNGPLIHAFTTSKNSLYLVYFLVFSIEALQKY